MSQNLYKTSGSVFFVPFGRENYYLLDLSKNVKYEILDSIIIKILLFFIEPHVMGDFTEANVDQEVVVECIRLGFLVPTDDVNIWEKYNWQRTNFLISSQKSIPYYESVNKGKELLELTTERRRLLEEYAIEEKYPDLKFPGRFVDKTFLDSPQEEYHISFNKIRDRKSIRSFGNEKIDFKSFCRILFYSTENIREMERSKKEIYFLLNSFYCWLNLYIVIQGVEGVENGYYFYDPFEHSLYRLPRAFNKTEIVDSVQGQNWIGDIGFCLYFVVQWERYQWLYRHSRAYINLLIQLGDLGQEFLFNATQHGLAGWMTPAVKEKEIQEMLDLQPCIQAPMYFMKLAR